jgi:voltage-gated hydrogen channel 1
MLCGNLNVPQGIAVGAGEIEEENAKIYAQCRQTLEETLSDLKAAREECQELRKRVATLEGGTS